MTQYFLTFGQNHNSYHHRTNLHNGWLIVLAENIDEARDIAFDRLGPAWSTIYEAREFQKGYFPYGPLGTLDREGVHWNEV